MPGIVGIITRMPRAQAERELLRMLEALCHEKFYVTGTWVDEALGSVCRLGRATKFFFRRHAAAE